DRQAAVNAMARALDDFEVEGIGHNLPFLSAVMRQERFRSGRLTTAYIAEEFPDGFSGVEPDEAEAQSLAAIAALMNLRAQKRAVLISGAMDNHRRMVGKDWVVTLGRKELALSIDSADELAAVRFGNDAVTVASDWLAGHGHAVFAVEGERVGVKTSAAGSGWRLRWRGIDVVARVRTPRVAELARL